MVSRSTGDGARAYTTPRLAGAASLLFAYLPTFAGGVQAARARSGLDCDQVSPSSEVFHNVFDAKKSVPGSNGEKTTGCVRMTRYEAPSFIPGAIWRAWVVRRWWGVFFPP